MTYQVRQSCLQWRIEPFAVWAHVVDLEMYFRPLQIRVSIANQLSYSDRWMGQISHLALESLEESKVGVSGDLTRELPLPTR